MSSITRLRSLIRRVETDLDALTPADREEIRRATAILRKSHTVQLGMPTVRPAAGDTRLGREPWIVVRYRPISSRRRAPTTPPADAGASWPPSTTRPVTA
ncbi:MAG: hypothetical protein ACRDP3_17600 [Streptomyces sp.]|uniref:hypothetical protein n=1 Tax=Streptomyces sp. TaxID=1931 RepID=UPI003D6B8BFB